jgi:Leucine-rich repeat (LRR) protein
VWHLTALRHLNLADNHGFDSIPSDISHLKQLQLLDMSDPGVPELPEELGTWLPQLEVLQVDYTPITAVPKGLTRLTRLNISGTFVRYLADLPHDLGALKQLVLHQSMLRPPLEGLSRLSALETLHLGWQEEPSWDLSRASCLPGPLPRLTSLNLCAVPPGLLAGLRGGMGVQGVTHLTLEALERQHMAAVAQLGVLPHLKHLVLMGSSGISWAALGAWLHQQPSLVRLRLSSGHVEGQELQQLPEQLEELVVCWCQLPDGQLPNLAHLTRLRCLHVDHVHHLPPWLTALSSLEELVLLSSGGVLSGAEVLAQLPNLRRVAGSGWQRGACRRAPHLCWAERTSL